MKIIAVICEYNIFHNGHKEQLELIRSAYGEDAAIVAIMSGNFVQRGEAAVMPKYDRAKLALEYGADLVLELPFPWSCSGAEYFARAAVWIASSLGVVDVLCFGSETGDLEILRKCTANITSDKFKDALDSEFESSVHTPESNIKLRQRIYSKLFGEEYPVKPNDILAVEYLKALGSFESNIQPFTHKRVSSFSATSSRKAFSDGNFEELSKLVPPASCRACESQGTPAKLKNAESAILFGLRSLETGHNVAECGGGGVAYLKKNALEAATLEEYFENAATKKYTSAKIRRMTLNALLSVAPSDVSELPEYTVLLAANKKGCRILSKTRRSTNGFSIITKPSDTKRFSAKAKMQYKLSNRADSLLYPLTLPKSVSPRSFLAISPFIEKDK